MFDNKRSKESTITLVRILRGSQRKIVVGKIFIVRESGRKAALPVEWPFGSGQGTIRLGQNLLPAPPSAAAGVVASRTHS
jgi:hypothetical protein